MQLEKRTPPTFAWVRIPVCHFSCSSYTVVLILTEEGLSAAFWAQVIISYSVTVAALVNIAKGSLSLDRGNASIVRLSLVSIESYLRDIASSYPHRRLCAARSFAKSPATRLRPICILGSAHLSATVLTLL